MMESMNVKLDERERCKLESLQDDKNKIPRYVDKNNTDREADLFMVGLSLLSTQSIVQLSNTLLRRRKEIIPVLHQHLKEGEEASRLTKRWQHSG